MLRSLFILLFAAPVAAQTADTPVVADTTLPEVTVTAARVALRAEVAPSRVTLTGSEEVSAANATSVADLLGARTSLFIRRYGASGLASMSLRGATASQTLVLLDGQRLTDPQLGQLDMSLLPTIMLQSVEVMHGGGSALYGTDAMGGVVHLRSRMAADRFTGQLRSEIGAWGERRIGGLASGSVRNWNGIFAVENEAADEDFLYRDGSLLGQPLVRNEGWDRNSTCMYGRVGYENGRNSLHGSVLFTDAERGLGGSDSVGARQWDTSGRFWLDGSRTTSWGKINASGYVQRSRLRYASPYPSDRPGAIDDTGETTVLTASGETHVTAISGWHLVGNASVGRSSADHPSLVQNARDSYAAASLSAAQTSGQLRLYPAIRLDAYVPSAGEAQFSLSPQLGLNWSLLNSETLRTKATIGRSFRMPTLNDRFWQPGGSPDLLPESGWSGDVGLLWASDRSSAEITMFGAVADNQIVWLPTAGGYHAPQNIAKTRSMGLELSVDHRWRLGSSTLVEIGGVGSLTDARDRSDPMSSSYNHQLRYVPKWTAKAWSSIARGRFQLDVGGQVIGRRFVTTDGTLSLDPYVVLEGQFRYSRPVGPLTLTLGLAAENLTDIHYEVIQSYVMPPRHFSVRLTLQTR